MCGRKQKTNSFGNIIARIMRKQILPAVALLASILVTVASAETPRLNIKLVHDSPLERQSQDQLQRLATQYDLKKYTVTRQINIEQGAVAHSSPVLTLNGRFIR